MYQDTPGPTGLSPYEIVYGRQRHEASPPFEGVTAEAAIDLFNKRRDSLNKVQRELQEMQDNHVKNLKRTKSSPPPPMRSLTGFGIDGPQKKAIPPIRYILVPGYFGKGLVTSVGSSGPV